MRLRAGSLAGASFRNIDNVFHKFKLVILNGRQSDRVAVATQRARS